MVDARLPKSKGKEKIDLFSNVPPTELSGLTIVEPMSNYNNEENGELIVLQILKKGSQPRLKIDLFSNAPPTELSRPAIVESMSDSSEDGNGEPIMPTSQHQSTITAKPSNEPSEGQCQKVFDRLGPRKQTDGPTSVRRRLDFDAPFYNEDYYS
ncbi:hypothetical protein ACFX2C_019357 [Malus domestica]